MNDALRWFGSSGISLIEYLANRKLRMVLTERVFIAYGVAVETSPAALVSFVYPCSLPRAKESVMYDNAPFVNLAQTLSVGDKVKMRNA